MFSELILNNLSSIEVGFECLKAFHGRLRLVNTNSKKVEQLLILQPFSFLLNISVFVSL